MNFVIDKETILPPVMLATSVVEKKQTLPILSNLYFKLEGGSLNIVGTDLEVEISVTINNVSGEDASFTVSATKILDITRKLPNRASIVFNLDSNVLSVSSGASRYRLRSLDADDFPRIETQYWQERLKIKQSDMRSLLDKTSFSMGVNDVRFSLNGILLEMKENTIRSVASNGHRLSKAEMDIDVDVDQETKLIIPRKAVFEISKLIDPVDESDITISSNIHHFQLVKDQIVLTTKLIDAKYPEFSHSLHSDTDNKITVNRRDLIDSLTRVSVLSDEKNKAAKVSLSDGKMNLCVKTLEQEEAVEEIDVPFQGEAISSGFNVFYIIDALNAIRSESAEMYFQGNNGFCVLMEPENDRASWLIMPVKI